MKILQHFLSKTAAEGDCLVWKRGKNKTGYGRFTLNGRMVLAHRASFELHYGHLPKDICVLHKCDNRACVKPEHLFLGNQKENLIDMNKKGRRFSKISAEDAREIRTIYAKGKITQSDIGKAYGICQVAVSDIINRKIWKNV